MKIQHMIRVFAAGLSLSCGLWFLTEILYATSTPDILPDNGTTTTEIATSTENTGTTTPDTDNADENNNEGDEEDTNQENGRGNRSDRDDDEDNDRGRGNGNGNGRQNNDGDDEDNENRGNNRERENDNDEEDNPAPTLGERIRELFRLGTDDRSGSDDASGGDDGDDNTNDATPAEAQNRRPSLFSSGIGLRDSRSAVGTVRGFFGFDPYTVSPLRPVESALFVGSGGIFFGVGALLMSGRAALDGWRLIYTRPKRIIIKHLS